MAKKLARKDMGMHRKKIKDNTLPIQLKSLPSQMSSNIDMDLITRRGI